MMLKWFEQLKRLSLRERVMVIAGGLFLVTVLIYITAVEPMLDRMQRLDRLIAGKLNLNDLAALTDREASDSLKLQDHIRRFEQLFELLFLDITLLDAILDWLDPDNRQRAHGAEAPYYGALDRPYDIKNGPFDSLSELRLVKGMTEQAFERLSPFVTVYPRAPKGITPVNINTANPIVLQALGDQGNISEAIAGDIL
ncbi:MAG TPA: hypothetical protein EYN74_02135, partial [Nitrospirales bacterium]|nr:hypothetical protein [Nitrospirales bacterium]